MTYAIDLEDKLSKYYEEASKKGGINSDEFKNRAKMSIKRKTKLERSRRENITEITLEPIEGLNQEDYKLNFSNLSLESFKATERIISKYYRDAGPKINVLESRRIFKKYCKEHSDLE